MTDTATQLARYKRLAQEQAETIRRLREERDMAWPAYQNELQARALFLQAANQVRQAGDSSGGVHLDLPRNVHGLK